MKNKIIMEITDDNKKNLKLYLVRLMISIISFLLLFIGVQGYKMFFALKIDNIKINPNPSLQYYCKETVPDFSFIVNTNGENGVVEYEILSNNKPIKKSKIDCQKQKSDYKIKLPNKEWTAGAHDILLKTTIKLNGFLTALSQYIPMTTESINNSLEFKILENNMEGYVLICGDSLNPAFHIMENEVSIAEYKSYKSILPSMPLIRETIHEAWSQDYEYHYPVLNVSWKDAECYCESRKARLPTSEEWEISFIQEETKLKLNQINNCPCGFITSTLNHDVEYNQGIYNLNCNAIEWCFDWDDKNEGLKRIRGAGSFKLLNKPGKIYFTDYSIGHDSIGFRCVVNKNHKFEKKCNNENH